MLEIGLIQQASNTPTGVVEVTVGPGGQPTYTIAEPAAWDQLKATPEALRAAERAKALCFGTLAQRAEPSRSAIREIVMATGPECLRVLDVNARLPFFGEEVLRWSLAHVAVAKISDEELNLVARALGFPSLPSVDELTLAAIEACARGILQRHPGLTLLAITLGPRGSLLLTPDKVNYHPGFPVAVADTVGAGDAFTAGLVHAILSGASLEASNTVGNLCGSFVASRQGATPTFPAQLLSRVAAAIEGS